MAKRFDGKVVWITGGGSGMGRLAARNLASAGKKVAALDVDEAGLAETAAGHAGILTYRVDVTQPAAVEAVVKVLWWRMTIVPKADVQNG